MVDHVHYFSDVLKPWIGCRDRLGKFVLRRDPRDISRIWVLDPEGGAYLPVPYRTLSHPPISVWEHRGALARLREQGRAQVDEQALFRVVEQMRSITDTAATTTRRARRDAQRRRHASAGSSLPRPGLVPPAGDGSLSDVDVGDTDVSGADAAAPFEEIEQW